MIIIAELDQLLDDINKLRKNLEQLIENNLTNLLDSDVLAASRVVDDAITKYNEFIKNKL